MTDAPYVPGTEPAKSQSDLGNYVSLRVWPPLLMLVGIGVARWLPSLWEDGPAMLWMSSAFGPALCGVGILLWWIALSRATVLERVVGFVGCVTAIAISVFQSHPSMLGPATLILTIPMGTILFGIGAILFRNELSFKRTVVALLLAACGAGFSMLLRNGGMWGDFQPELSWRWRPSAEETMLASKQDAVPVTLDESQASALADQLGNPEWPGFRGPDRNSRQAGVVFADDWSSNPPEELWRISVGPAWSSFVVAGDRLFTQEQRGESESVVCYDANTGGEIWTQEIQDRFEEALGGVGPRATPMLAKGELYAMGAGGNLLKMNAVNGELLWQVDVKEVASCGHPMWGFSSSPLVLDATTVVHVGGKGDKGILAFNNSDGSLAWSSQAGIQSYSSPQLATIDGETLILLTSDEGLHGYTVNTGETRFKYEWSHEGYRSLQPQVVDDTIIIPSGMGTGTRRIRFKSDAGQIEFEELWTSRQLKPDYNDFVVYRDHAYGFDGMIFTCIDLETGKRAWKKGRYGKGQVLLLSDSGTLLVVTEKGGIVLLEANAEKHTELAKLDAMEGKTWNHPVVVGDRLYLRNAREAVCYRLPRITVTEQDAI